MDSRVDVWRTDCVCAERRRCMCGGEQTMYVWWRTNGVEQRTTTRKEKRLFSNRRILPSDGDVLIHHVQELLLLLRAAQRHHERLLPLRAGPRLNAHTERVLRIADHRRVLRLTSHLVSHAHRRVVQQNLLALPLVPLLVRVHRDLLVVDHEVRIQPRPEETALTER